jgi:DNA-nicking Smr family endonuclease
VARTVLPLEPAAMKAAPVAPVAPVSEAPPVSVKRPRGRVPAPLPAPPAHAPAPPRPLDRHGLDAGWDRQLGKGTVSPDFTLDLHGASLDAAHARLDHGLALAIAQGARLVLVVTGRARPYDPADRGSRRGAIRAKFLDWLAAGPHAGRIAAVRAAHPRHGGAGALYVVLRRVKG